MHKKGLIMLVRTAIYISILLYSIMLASITNYSCKYNQLCSKFQPQIPDVSYILTCKLLYIHCTDKNIKTFVKL